VWVEDPTQGSTHYYDKRLDAHPPSWSRPPARRVALPFASDLRFYKDVP
jgi:hypothetical protein